MYELLALELGVLRLHLLDLTVGDIRVMHCKENYASIASDNWRLRKRLSFQKETKYL